MTVSSFDQCRQDLVVLHFSLLSFTDGAFFTKEGKTLQQQKEYNSLYCHTHSMPVAWNPHRRFSRVYLSSASSTLELSQTSQMEVMLHLGVPSLAGHLNPFRVFQTKQMTHTQELLDPSPETCSVMSIFTKLDRCCLGGYLALGANEDSLLGQDFSWHRGGDTASPGIKNPLGAKLLVTKSLWPWSGGMSLFPQGQGDGSG